MSVQPPHHLSTMKESPLHGAQPVVLLGHGTIWHERTKPSHNAFSYGAYYLMLPMRSLHRTMASPLPRNRFAPLSFFDCDHGEGGHDALAWIESVLKKQGVEGVDGEVWLQTFPRVWGYTFKPVSLWYAYSQSGQLQAVVAEVNNTFGQRHCYLLTGEALSRGEFVVANKVFHVSPFCDVAGHYRFAFAQKGAWQSVQIDLRDASGAIVKTSWRGKLEAYSPAKARQMMWQYPFMTLGVVLKIHWQALKLWFKRVPFFSLPPKPEEFVSK